MNSFRVEDSSFSGPVSLLADQLPSDRPLKVAKLVTAFACMAAAPGLASTHFSKVAAPPAEVRKSTTIPVHLSDRTLHTDRTDLAAIDRVGQSHSGIWVETEVSGAWIQKASDRIKFLAAKAEGWKGPGSIAPSPKVISDAFALAQKLRAEGCKAEPMIGADEDGEMVFYWKTEAAVASISIDGDGSFSVYVKSATENLSEDGCRIADQLPSELVRTFDLLDAKEV